MNRHDSLGMRHSAQNKGSSNAHVPDGVDPPVDVDRMFDSFGSNDAEKSTSIDSPVDLLQPTSWTTHRFEMEARGNRTSIHTPIGILPDGYFCSRRTGQQHTRLQTIRAAQTTHTYNLPATIGHLRYQEVNQ